MGSYILKTKQTKNQKGILEEKQGYMSLFCWFLEVEKTTDIYLGQG